MGDQSESQKGQGSSLALEVSRHLAMMIVAGHYEPGARIREVAVAKELNVSRGSVREALLVLERRYLIELEPRKGARVVSMEPGRIEQFYEMLTDLLSMVTRNVCRYWDENRRHLDGFKACLAKIDQCILENQYAGVLECHFVFWQIARVFSNNIFLDQMLDDLEYLFRWCMMRVINSGPTQVATIRVFLQRLLEQIEARSEVTAVAMVTGVYREQSNVVIRRILNHRDLGRPL